MESLRHLTRTVGRALALLAVLMLVLAPALPAHAHAHEPIGTAQTHVHGKAAGTADRGDAGDVAGHAADCCFVCHVSVLPGGLHLPSPVSHPRDLVWVPDGLVPSDVLAERLPEPPRSIA